MPRSPSSILFALILCLSFALVVWWTIFQVHASGELEAAGLRLLAAMPTGPRAHSGRRMRRACRRWRTRATGCS